MEVSERNFKFLSINKNANNGETMKSFNQPKIMIDTSINYNLELNLK